MLGEGFGPGANGPLLVVADMPHGDGAVLQRLEAGLGSTAGVTAVSPPRLDSAGEVALITVVPGARPQQTATEDLVHTLRDHVIPAATKGTAAQVHVGGATAANIDINASIASRLPLIIGGVVIVSMFLLLVAFRSLAIAITAAVMNLLSAAASYGVVAFFLNGGWAGKLIGIDTPTPLAAYNPVIMFALLFGLSSPAFADVVRGPLRLLLSGPASSSARATPPPANGAMADALRRAGLVNDKGTQTGKQDRRSNRP